MKTNILLLVGLTIVGSVLSGCVNEQGRLRPIDPLGRAIFNALDPAPRNYNNQYNRPSYPQYGNNGYPQQRGQGNVWVEGAYGRDSYGRRVWIPAHWVR